MLFFGADAGGFGPECPKENGVVDRNTCKTCARHINDTSRIKVVIVCWYCSLFVFMRLLVRTPVVRTIWH